MKLRCAVLDDYQNVALSLADWSVLGDRVEPVVFRQHIESEQELAERLQDFPIVVIMRERTPFPASLFARLPRLKLLVTTGMRNASVDLAAAAAHGVAVCGTGGAGAGTAELTWALILGLARSLVKENQALRMNGRWQGTVGADLSGKRLGIIGLGKIGSQVAQVGRAFGMEVSAWSQNLTLEKAEQAGVRYAAKEDLLAESDYVTVHLVLSDRTRGLIGGRELALLKPTAYLINTSRAPIVDQAALIDALRHRRIAGAGLDVFEAEPLPDDHPYRFLPNVLATPHIGYVTEAGYRVFFEHVVENIGAYLAGSPIRTLS
ncbi:D-2-hydroxyacid dehydrogenase family protein [Cohnella zeiphila]|uniref:D-2-hydroxyacid dehydrogenase family protein n=1 Tax=Cohnella zeiphila TaxID=2761120 RepID=A0A7X0SJH9_9BACL|nr:D-2-hydroxyacid dehydrogenase family protein [Cohnella zeiphila]MBB6731135.1 D-2-hydroxyacid dehydrogenase family protein [Cohnella zeiphila]